MQSRLSKTTERKTKKQLYVSLFGIAAVIFVLFKFGIPALTNLSLFLSNFSNSSSTPSNQTVTNAVINPPVLNQPFTATNSATISVSGQSLPKQTIQLFVNSAQVGSTTTNTDGTFNFSEVNLTQQQNTIQVKAEVQGKTSDFSDSWTVSLLQKAPSLTIDSPHDGDTFDSSHPTVTVSGKTDPNAKVTVNGFWAIVDASGNYSYTLSLQNGDNKITVVATDAAGNSATQSITVHHSQ